MKHFGITQTPKKTWKNYVKYINGTFVILILVCFIFFMFFSNVTNMIFKNKVDVFKEDLGEIAFYSWIFDKNLSNFLLTLDDIVQGYIQGENVFISKEKEINICWDYIQKNKEYLKKV